MFGRFWQVASTDAPTAAPPANDKETAPACYTCIYIYQPATYGLRTFLQTISVIDMHSLNSEPLKFEFKVHSFGCQICGISWVGTIRQQVPSHAIGGRFGRCFCSDCEQRFSNAC